MPPLEAVFLLEGIIMYIKVTFERNGIIKEYELPLDNVDIIDVRRELGIPNEEEINWGNFSDENIFPNTIIVYERTRCECMPYVIPPIMYPSLERSFLAVNILAYVMQCYLYKDEIDALNIYTEYRPPRDILELMNYIISMERIYDYYHVSQYDYSYVEEGYAKTAYGYRFPREYWEYVDFIKMGEEYGQDSVWFGDYGWICDSEIGSISITDYSFEQLLEDFEWELTPPPSVQFDASDVMEFLNEV